jgi:hypothetical protein
MEDVQNLLQASDDEVTAALDTAGADFDDDDMGAAYVVSGIDDA